jgi:secreted Zn-dependent insulinase-like peptidase
MSKLKLSLTALELIKFLSKFYSANLMKLCHLGDESLEELEEYPLK